MKNQKIQKRRPDNFKEEWDPLLEIVGENIVLIHEPFDIGLDIEVVKSSPENNLEIWMRKA